MADKRDLPTESDVARVFTPATPVHDDDLFAGRIEQLRRVIDAVFQPGQHVVVFGERGVGKTSLANVLEYRIGSSHSSLLAARINCDATDNYGTLWKKAFDQIERVASRRPPGFTAPLQHTITKASASLSSSATPDEVRRALDDLAQSMTVYVILDEFDKLANKHARRAVADTVKTLADHDCGATLVIVGVADNIDTLISDHASIERNLVQVEMPRMTTSEVAEIVRNGMKKLRMEIDDDVVRGIALIAQGLPHYAHLLGSYATRSALDSDRGRVALADLTASIKSAVGDRAANLQSEYRRATESQQPDNLYAIVLLACAMATCDEFGYFGAGAVASPLSGLRSQR